MKKIYFILVAVALFISGAGASAQVMDEVINTADFTYSSFTLNAGVGDDDDEISTDMDAVSLNWAQARAILPSLPVYLQYGVGLQYAWDSDTEKEDGYSYKSTMTFLTAKVPVNVMYYFNVPTTEIALVPYAGINLQGHIIGQQKSTVKYDGDSQSSSSSFFSKEDMEDEAFNRFVVGWQIGAKVAYKKYYVGIAYEGPVTNLYKYEDIIKVNTNQINISFGIKF